jgi:hypothetical protein
MAGGARSPHNARIAFDCKDTWQSCCSALAPGVALNGPSMRSIRRCATSPLPPSGDSCRQADARRDRAQLAAIARAIEDGAYTHTLKAHLTALEQENAQTEPRFAPPSMRRCCDSIPTSPSSIVARSGASPRRSTPWDPLSNRRQKLPSTGYIATIGNEPAQIPASPKQIRPVAILHPHLASRFPPEAENLPHKEVEIRAPRAMVVDRDPQTVLTVDGRVRNGSDASSCSRSMISTLRRFNAGSSWLGGQ